MLRFNFSDDKVLKLSFENLISLIFSEESGKLELSEKKSQSIFELCLHVSINKLNHLGQGPQ